MRMTHRLGGGPRAATAEAAPRLSLTLAQGEAGQVDSSPSVMSRGETEMQVLEGTSLSAGQPDRGGGLLSLGHRLCNDLGNRSGH